MKRLSALEQHEVRMGRSFFVLVAVRASWHLTLDTLESGWFDEFVQMHQHELHAACDCCKCTNTAWIPPQHACLATRFLLESIPGTCWLIELAFLWRLLIFMCLFHLLKHKATALIGAVGSNETIGNLLLTSWAHGPHLMAWDILTLSPARPMMAHPGHFHLFNKSIFRCAVISVLVWYEQEALVILYHDGKFREYSCLFRGQHQHATITASSFG
jgi:hypothetical protein